MYWWEEERAYIYSSGCWSVGGSCLSSLWCSVGCRLQWTAYRFGTKSVSCFSAFSMKVLRCGPKSELCNFTSRDFLRIKHPNRTEFQWSPQHSLLVSPVSPGFVWSCAWGRPVSSGVNGSAPSICMLPSTGQDSGKAEDFLQESGQLFYGDCGSLFCQGWESDMGHVCLRHLLGRVLKITCIFLIKSHSSAQSNSPDVWLYFGKIYMQIM